jgi:hypothetical protein
VSRVEQLTLDFPEQQLRSDVQENKL